MKQPCRHPGCNALLPSSGYCEAHKADAPKPRANYERWRRRDPKQSAIDRFRSSSAWRELSKRKIRSNPLCEDPYREHDRKGTTETAKQVHHIKGLATHPELGMVWGNLMSVCYGCHARLEADVRRGDSPSE